MFDFDMTLKSAQSAWNNKLGVISVKAQGVSDELQTVFWSGVYRANISPQDYTGENPLWQSSEPYYDSYYWYALYFILPDDTWLTHQAVSGTRFAVFIRSSRLQILTRKA